MGYSSIIVFKVSKEDSDKVKFSSGADIIGLPPSEVLNSYKYGEVLEASEENYFYQLFPVYEIYTVERLDKGNKIEYAFTLQNGDFVVKSDGLS